MEKKQGSIHAPKQGMMACNYNNMRTRKMKVCISSPRRGEGGDAPNPLSLEWPAVAPVLAVSETCTWVIPPYSTFHYR